MDEAVEHGGSSGGGFRHLIVSPTPVTGPAGQLSSDGMAVGWLWGCLVVFQDRADTPAAPWEECRWLLDGDSPSTWMPVLGGQRTALVAVSDFCSSAAAAGIPRSCTAQPSGVTMVCRGRRTGRHGAAGQMAGQVIASSSLVVACGPARRASRASLHVVHRVSAWRHHSARAKGEIVEKKTAPDLC